jgi:hypothetical protein
MLKIFINFYFFNIFFTACFLPVKNMGKISYNRNPEKKSFGGIWSSGEDSMMLYMGDRQIFETSQEVHKRGG